MAACSHVQLRAASANLANSLCLHLSNAALQILQPLLRWLLFRGGACSTAAASVTPAAVSDREALATLLASAFRLPVILAAACLKAPTVLEASWPANHSCFSQQAGVLLACKAGLNSG
jgi:hypothetical protein